MTLCVVDGKHCVCQPEEGIPCIPALNMKAEIERLRKIEEAAKNLLSVKGRHHTEQAYKKLEDTLIK